MMIEEGYETVEKGQEKEGDEVLIGTTWRVVADYKEDLWVAGNPLPWLVELGCRVRRKKPVEPLRWTGEWTCEQWIGEIRLSPVVPIPRWFIGKRVRITVEELLTGSP